jgi:hypothetical protein
MEKLTFWALESFAIGVYWRSVFLVKFYPSSFLLCAEAVVACVC